MHNASEAQKQAQSTALIKIIKYEIYTARLPFHANAFVCTEKKVA